VPLGSGLYTVVLMSIGCEPQLRRPCQLSPTGLLGDLRRNVLAHLPLTTAIAWVSVWLAIPAASVPARGLVEMVTDGRSAWVGRTALSRSHGGWTRRVGGISNSPYA